MTAPRRFSFSLLTIFVVTVIAALSISQVVLMRRMEQARQDVANAQAEVAEVRTQFGYILMTDPHLVHIARIESGEDPAIRYRMIIPRGCHYMLHITDMLDFPASGFPVDPQPTETMSMNSWRDGADVILHWNMPSDPDGTPRLVVATDSDELFSYRIEEWKKTGFPNTGWKLETNEKQTFKPDETIRFMTHSNDETRRGVMLWMEPVEQWYKRRGESVPAGS
jgi:hypothetical protein